MESWITFVLGFLTAFVFGWLLFRRWQKNIEEHAKERLELARREADLSIKDSRAKLEFEFEKRRAVLEQDTELIRRDLRQKEEEGVSALLAAEKEREVLEKRRETLDRQISALEEREDLARSRISEYREKLQNLVGMDCQQARQALLNEAEEECRDEIREMKEVILQRAEREVQLEGRNILIACMQRLAAKPQHDITATIVKLPGEEMKGRIIGREGRNIKAFESTTGTTLLIDETPESVLISSFDPVRREVARIALEALMRDGRIHPASIEDAVREAENEVKQSVIAFGEEAIRRLRLSRVHPEVIGLLGRMHYRLANNQNSLEHSVEVAHLCALMAAELGLDPEIAKRCGLFHDIGKVLDEDYGGSHAAAGANLLKRYGNEDPRVINAVHGHHNEVPPESPYVALLMTADSLSAMRPGARAESIDSYIQRVRNLEAIAREFEGVADAYAIQAGREIRVIVAPDRIDDAGARRLATKIRRRVENEMQYPGTIKVTVVRESRISETAK